MFNIEKYLQKFSKGIQDTELQRQKIAEIIENESRIAIPLKCIELKNYTVYLDISPGEKNKVFINKNKILDDFKKFLPIKILDVR